jgi:hypothetical protein
MIHTRVRPQSKDSVVRLSLVNDDDYDDDDVREMWCEDSTR